NVKSKRSWCLRTRAGLGSIQVRIHYTMRRNSMGKRGLMVGVLAAAVLAGVGVSQADWTRFRGANGSGVEASANTPASFTEKEFKWKIALPGTGHSSPVVTGNKVLVTCADPKEAT